MAAKVLSDKGDKKQQFSAYLTIRLPNGEKQQKKFYGKTKKEAQRKRDRARAEYETGLLVLNSRTTVSEYAERWGKQAKLSTDMQRRLKNYCTEIIGSLEIGEVRPFHIRSCFGELEGKSASLISKTCGVINRMFKMAVVDGLILRNPCEDVERPRGPAGKRRAMTEEEEKAFLEILKRRVTDGKHWYDIAFGITYACGLRPGEVRALTRTNVCMEEGKASIKVTQACKGKTREIGPPKTEDGNRLVPIPDWFLPYLRQAIKDAPPSLWVIPANDGKCLSYQTLTRRWEFFLREMQMAAGAKKYRNKIVVSPLGNDLTPYHLRHMYCTNLAYAGVSEVVAKTWMGHKDSKMIQEVYTDAKNTKLIRKAASQIKSFDPSKTETDISADIAK